MKTKYWLCLIGALLAVSLGMSLILSSPGAPAARAEIRSDGRLIRTVDLSVNQSFTVTGEAGDTNTITVLDGKIAVTQASCPDHYCMARGYCNSGAQIVCLPNRLTITFLGETAVDSVVG